MNKTEFIKALAEKVHYSDEDTLKINEILEKNFFISSKNKEKIIKDLCTTFTILEEEADFIYKSAKNILKEEIKGV